MNNNNGKLDTLFKEHAKKYVDMLLFMAEHEDVLHDDDVFGEFLDIIVDLMAVDLEIIWGDYPLPEETFYELLYIYLCEKLGLDDGENDETHD